MTVSRTPKVGLYGRVSTADQRADLQLDALRSLAEQRKWPIHDEYIDAGYSGTKDRRLALDRRMADARKGIVLVMDNLNIHDLSCLYEAFEHGDTNIGSAFSSTRARASTREDLRSGPP
jgi:predicted site-specific integrase-resolvase